jgi:dTDP-4-amino-4,6-dideoxygalactose transaminase
MADMEKIQEIAKNYGILVIEDACQAIGAKYKEQNAGTMGDFGAFSFFPTKNLGAYGDGGLVTVKDEKHYEYLKMFRLHGAKKKYFHEFAGINSRLDAIQAAILSVKLDHLNQWNEKRGKIAEKYDAKIKGILQKPAKSTHKLSSYHQYPLVTKDRDNLQKYLKENDISSAIYYPLPLHLQECFKYLGYKVGDLPVSEKISQTILSIPIYPEMSDEQVDYVSQTINNYF